MSRGSNSKINVLHSSFLSIKGKTSVLAGKHKSNISIIDCNFLNTMVTVGAVSSSRGTVDISNSIFDKNWAPAVSVANSRANINNVSFSNSFAINKWSVYGETSQISIKNSQFSDQSLKSLIHNNGNSELYRLTFNSSKEYSLSSKLAEKCIECNFGIAFTDSTSNFIMIQMFVIYALIIAIVISLLKRRKIFKPRKLL
ncbi:hypothetical protein TVAG_431720 [Trichomonas vaginalis G3]|uniref:Right handed beta helix domain-containing protein n=1 Tax=Trichomonas vaginalis (strain ATCC PRA-98 / G3) TaxID=412133 RepID=A2G0H4_TRIV3|nr:pectin lyase-like family [Trichomonas vaginalis G3]EAX89349.1 hypothetical protein TVAG_431720 [Trichomonas vaginalis G3]KAI5553677.1 pectin lyase-like family [Trichomonas vaginalis G3]|eukprot:XP_001302279.1 hypothetical protein [Trichomonas vaginalis G3]